MSHPLSRAVVALSIGLAIVAPAVAAEVGTWFAPYPGNPLALESIDPWDSLGDPHLQIPGAVHPDVLYFPQGMDGYKFWMVFTPGPEINSVPWNPSVTPDWYWERMTLVRSNDGIHWQKTDDYKNPLFAPGPTGSWDDRWHADPDLVYAPSRGPNGESWFLYYVGLGPNLTSRIGVALSHDGREFTTYAGNPIMPSYTRCPAVVYDAASGLFRAWYNWGPFEVGYATSSDGLHWTPYNPSSPGTWGHVVMQGTPGTYDQGGISHMDVVRRNGFYWMYYLANPTSGSNPYQGMVVGRATSADGVSWSKDPAPVVTPTGSWSFWPSQSSTPVQALYRPAAVAVDGAMYLYYGGLDSYVGYPVPNYDIGLAFSSRFFDVLPTHGAYNAIEHVAAAGITSGCGGGNYCPDASISRKQAAVFIVLGAGFQPSTAAYNAYFDDVANDPFAPWINRMKELGISAGCGTRVFCPEAIVDRGAAAVFIVTALGQGPSGAPANAYFDDVAGHWTAPFVNRLYELGITGGCAPRQYCPGSPVSRASMAVFVDQAFLQP